MKQTTFKFKLTILLAVISVPVFGYFIYTVIGNTVIGVTIKTNPDLQLGLVGHWTFDGKDVTGGGGTWYDHDFTYKRALTITAGGTSGGAATTTANGYAVLATTTLSTLMATSSGGNVQKLDANNNLPFDVIFTDDDDTTLLDFHIEKYASTTGELVAWIEVENLSSTTAQTFNMYYGNASATDKSNETGTWNSTYAGVWHLAEDPSISTDGTCGGGTAEVCDSTSNNNDGDSAGTMTTSDQVAGQVDGSLDFDGAGDYIDTNAHVVNTSTNFTYSAWIKKAVDSNEDTIFFTAGSGTSKFYITSGNKFAYRTNQDNTGGTTNILIASGWTQLVALYDGADIRTYINGVLEATETKTATDSSLNPHLIGGESSSSFMGGLIDEVRIYNIALDPMDILTDYNMMVDNSTFLSWGGETTFSGGTANDVSGQGNNGTINLVQKRPGRVGQALEFNGTNDYVDVGAGPASVNTVAFWVYPDTTTEYFVNLTGTTDYIWVDGGTVTATGLTSPTIYVDGAVSSALVAGQWQHIAVTTATSENASNLDIGRTADTNYMQGKIDEFRIYSRALSAEEIKRLYELGATTRVNVTLDTNPDLRSGLVGHWTFDGKDMYSNVADTSGQGNHGALQGQTSTTTAPGRIGQALSFDGTDDYVDVADSSVFDLSASGSYSWSSWIKPTTFQEWSTVWAQVESISPEYNLIIYAHTTTDAANGPVTAGITIGWGSDGVNHGLVAHSTDNVLTAGTFSHIAITYDGSLAQASRFTIYVDGVDVTDGADILSYGTITGISPTSGNINIGRDGAWDDMGDMVIDDVRIYNRVLSSEEIKRLYEMGR